MGVRHYHTNPLSSVHTTERTVSLLHQQQSRPGFAMPMLHEELPRSGLPVSNDDDAEAVLMDRLKESAPTHLVSRAGAAFHKRMNQA